MGKFEETYMQLTLDIALKLLTAVLKIGTERGVPIAVTIVDLGGRILAATRNETVGYINLVVAERKATTSVNFSAPTHDVLAMLKDDPIALTTVTNEATLCVLPGGFPIVLHGVLVGGIGVAGGHYTQDQEIAASALLSL